MQWKSSTENSLPVAIFSINFRLFINRKNQTLTPHMRIKIFRYGVLFILASHLSNFLYAEDLKTLNNKGRERYKVSDYKGALEFYLPGLVEAQLQDNKRYIATFDTNIGLVYEHLGDYPKALEYHQQALKKHREIGNRYWEGGSLCNIGNVYKNLGDYPAALNCHRQGLKIHREIGNRNWVGADILNIGLIYDELGNYAKALKYNQQALKIARANGDRKVESEVLNNIGVIYENLGDYPKALEYYQQALKIKREIGDRKGERNTFGNIGIVYGEIGDYPRAMNYLQQVLKIKQKIGEPTDGEERSIGDIYLEQALLLDEQGNMEKAFEIYKKINQAIRLGRYYLLKKDWATAKKEFSGYLPYAEEKKNSADLIANYIGLALSYEGLKEYNNSFEYYIKGRNFLEKMRNGLSESQSLNFFGAKETGFPRLEPYEGLVRVSRFTEEGIRGSLYYAESTRSRIFTESVARKYGVPETRIPKDISEKETELTNKISSTYKQMDVAFEKKNTERYKELETDLASLKKEQDSFIATLRKNYPEYASVMYPQPVYVENIPLKQDEVIIEYEVTEPYTKFFVLNGIATPSARNDKAQIVASGDIKITRKDLVAMVKKFREPFEDVSLIQDGKFSAKLGKELYDLLLKSVLTAKDEKTGKPIIPKSAKIIIAPDEILGILPFESLVISLPEQIQMPVSKGVPTPLGVKYVGDEYDITYYQSATALTAQRTLKKWKETEKSLLVLADPIFSLADSRVRGTELARATRDEYQLKTMGAVVKQMGVGGARRGTSASKEIAKEGEAITFPRLDKTSVLAQSLAKKVFAGEPVENLTGVSASEQKIKGLDLSKYKYLVFATHGILDNTVPYIKEPALVLNQLGTDEENDGFLTMSEVMGLKLNADVVALTACQTGLGRNVSGEGVMGLGRAFQYAGAKSVLVSLWSVAEESTTMLVEKFFQYLKEGKTKREAVRLARADVRRSGYEHPFFWSPFILIGD